MAQLTGGVKSAHGPHREHQQERPAHNHEARSPEVSVGGSYREPVKSWDCKPTLRGPVASAHRCTWFRPLLETPWTLAETRAASRQVSGYGRKPGWAAWPFLATLRRTPWTQHASVKIHPTRKRLFQWILPVPSARCAVGSHGTLHARLHGRLAAGLARNHSLRYLEPLALGRGVAGPAIPWHAAPSGGVGAASTPGD